MDISFKDDVTVILLLGTSYKVARALCGGYLALYSESLAYCLVSIAKHLNFKTKNSKNEFSTFSAFGRYSNPLRLPNEGINKQHNFRL